MNRSDKKPDYSETDEYTLMTPDGHAVPGIIKPGVTLDAVQQFVAVERARNRRALLWLGTMFVFVSFLILTLFISVGIFVLRNSARATEIVGDIQARTIMTGVELLGLSNSVNRLQQDSRTVRMTLEEKEQARLKEQRILQKELERFSRWVAQRTGSSEDRVEPLLERVALMEAKIAERDAEIEVLRSEYEELKQLRVLRREQATADPKAEITAVEKTVEAVSPPEVVALPEAESVFVPAEPVPEEKQAVAVEERTPAVPEWGDTPEVRMPDRALLGHLSVVVFPNGDRYEGQFKDGLFNGWGIYQYAEGDRYEGEFRNDLKEGRGIYESIDGERYEGTFVRDVRHGTGRLIMPNGDRYAGEFRNGQMTGAGTILYANGNRYSGQVLQGRKHGKGTFTYVNGDVYEGEFSNDERNGQGIYDFSDGGRYIGEFRDGLRHGQGRYIFRDGSEYAGSFRNGLKDGTGVFVFEDGTRVRGLWKNDEFIQALDG